MRTVATIQQAVKNGETFNPYWFQWVMQTGGGANHEFIIWIRQKWLEFEPDERLRPEKRNEFYSWLVKQQENVQNSLF